MAALVTSRLVANAITTTVNVLPDFDAVTIWITGADGGMVRTPVGGGEGVTFTPEAVRVALRVIVPATVPVCRAICVAPPANVAVLLLAGTVNAAERPP